MPARDKSRSFVTREARQLWDEGFCRNEDQRTSAVNRVVEQLPRSLPDIIRLIRRRPHRLSGEVQFTVFVVLPHDLPLRIRKALLLEFENFLCSVNSDAGRSAWMCGDALAHWAEASDDGETELLLRSLANARYAAGRKGALHGLAHRLDHCGLRQGRRILECISLAAATDKSGKVRRSARYVLERGGCWSHADASPALVRFSRALLRAQDNSRERRRHHSH
jgi:hypothetical protein